MVVGALPPTDREPPVPISSDEVNMLMNSITSNVSQMMRLNNLSSHKRNRKPEYLLFMISSYKAYETKFPVLILNESQTSAEDVKLRATHARLRSLTYAGIGKRQEDRVE